MHESVGKSFEEIPAIVIVREVSIDIFTAMAFIGVVMIAHLSAGWNVVGDQNRIFLIARARHFGNRCLHCPRWTLSLRLSNRHSTHGALRLGLECKLDALKMEDVLTPSQSNTRIA